MTTSQELRFKSPFHKVCRTNFLAQFLFLFSGNPCKVFFTVIAIRLWDDMRVLVGPLSWIPWYCADKERLVGVPCVEVVSSTRGRGVPLFIGLRKEEKFSALGCEWMLSCATSRCVYCNPSELQYNLVLQISYINLLTHQWVFAWNVHLGVTIQYIRLPSLHFMTCIELDLWEGGHLNAPFSSLFHRPRPLKQERQNPM